jgi:hypothetical protein
MTDTQYLLPTQYGPPARTYQQLLSKCRMALGMIEACLDLPLESRQDAIDYVYRSKNPRDHGAGNRIGFANIPNREEYYRAAHILLPKVRKQLDAGRMTPRLADDFLRLASMSFYLMAPALDDSDPVAQARGGSRNNNAQRKWMAGMIEATIEPIVPRGRAMEAFDEAQRRVMAVVLGILRSLDSGQTEKIPEFAGSSPEFFLSLLQTGSEDWREIPDEEHLFLDAFSYRKFHKGHRLRLLKGKERTPPIVFPDFSWRGR